MKQYTLWQFSKNSLSADEQQVILYAPKRGAIMAIDALIKLFDHIGYTSQVEQLRNRLNIDAKNDLLHWLRYLQRNQYIGVDIADDDYAQYWFSRAEFLLTVVHLVANGATPEARLMLGLEHNLTTR